jgi:hypothetical protein
MVIVGLLLFHSSFRLLIVPETEIMCGQNFHTWNLTRRMRIIRIRALETDILGPGQSRI